MDHTVLFWQAKDYLAEGFGIETISISDVFCLQEIFLLDGDLHAMNAFFNQSVLLQFSLLSCRTRPQSNV